MGKLSIFLRFSRYLLPHWPKIAGGLACSGIATLLALVSPVITKVMLDTVFPKRDVSLLILLILVGIGLRLVGSANSFLRAYLSARTNTEVTFHLRTDFYQHLQRLSLSFFDRKPTGELMYRADGDVTNVVSMITQTVPTVAETLFRLGVLLVITLHLDWKLTLVCMTVVPVVWFNSSVFSKKMRQLNRTMQGQLSQISAGLQQAISGMRLVKAFGKEREEHESYSKRVRESLHTKFKSVLVAQLYSASGGLVHTLWSSFISLYCGLQVINGTLTVGEMMGLTLYVLQLYTPVASFWTTYTHIQRDLVSAERVLETLEALPEVVDARDAIPVPPLKGEIRFEQVTFGYESDRPVLRSASFVIPAGATVALVGPSGIGKTTIAGLLLRFYDPWEGRISIDGYDLRKLKLRSLKDQIGVVLQEPFLNSGTVTENIRYGKRGAIAEEVIRAAKLAHAHDFIMSLPQGYSTEIGERGVRLSVGQKQRIALARALIRAPRILILDEPTSSLDSESEAVVCEALASSADHRTVLLIAHRLSTITKADYIMVLDRGRIVEIGTHEQLMERRGRYYALYGEAA